MGNSVNRSQEEAEFKYYAFISYKHANAASGLYESDGAWANALDKELRYLNIPTEIDRSNLIHEDDDAVDPIFKDTSTLTIVPGGELEQELAEKLKESKTLVLILSKDMVRDQNERYDPNPKKSTAWIYWEVKTFLKYHNHDWGRIIPVYIDRDDYSPQLLKTRIGIEDHFDNIEKPYHDYRAEHDWDTEKSMFYQKTAAAVASDIFKVEKRAFWNIKEKAKEAQEAERKRAKSQRRFWILVACIVTILALSALALRQMSSARDYLNEARQALELGNRIEANRLAKLACRNWIWTKGAAEVLWASKDSTRSCMQVNSRVCVSDDLMTVSYLDNNKQIVFLNAETLDEENRIDVGAAQDFIMSGNGNVIACFNYQDRQTQIEIIDRVTGDRETKTLSFPSFYTEDVVINQSGDVIYLDGDDTYIRGKGQVYVHTGLKHDDYEELQYRSLSRNHCSASFFGRDSVLVVASELSGNKGRQWALEFYNMRQLTGGNFTEPTVSIKLGKNTERCFLSPYKPYMYISTKDSLYVYSVEIDGDYSIRRRCSDFAPNGVEEIRFSGQSYYKDVDLVIDKKGTGKMFYISGGGTSNGKQIIGFYDSYYEKNSQGGRPITLSGLEDGKGGPFILKYADSKKTINVSDAYRGFHIPDVANGERIDGYCLKHMTIVTVSGQKKYIDSHSFISYIFHGGDKRKVAYFGHAPHFLSSTYAVHSSFDLFVDGNSKHYSAALYHPITNEFVLNISQKEDMSMDNVSPTDYAINSRWLAASMRHADSSFSLRIFSLIDNALVGEISIPGNQNSIHLFKWIGDILIISTANGLCKVDMNLPRGLLCETIDHQFGQRSYTREDITNDNVFEYYRSPTYSYNRAWFISSRGQDRIIMPYADRHDNIKKNISNSGQYYSAYDSRAEVFSLVSTTLADTLWTTHTDINNRYWQHFSSDDSYLLYATDNNVIHCISLKTFREAWSLPIHIPFSCLIGKKNAVFASTSIFVVNLKSGRIVAEFPNYPMKEQVVKMSPDEKYLLCGESLYSIPGKQKLGDGFYGECVALENNYIVFRNYLMELPKLPSLFKRIE